MILSNNVFTMCRNNAGEICCPTCGKQPDLAIDIQGNCLKNMEKYLWKSEGVKVGE